MAKYATLKEVSIDWSINDLADSHEAIDITIESEQAEMKRKK